MAMNTVLHDSRDQHYTYLDLQKEMDKLIGRLGLYESVRILKNLSSNTQIKAKETDKLKLIQVYLIAQSIDIFNLYEDFFYTSTIREYRVARRSCYSLMRKYTDCSDAKIAEDFKQSSHRMVIYHRQKCQEMLSIPNSYKNTVAKHELLEQRLIDFISKLS